MNFWKPLLLTTSLFAAIVSTSILTSCEPNSCDGINCNNGGSCGSGVCNCPSSWEGVTCETEKRTRYLGVYGGFTECDNGAMTIDTVSVYPANRGRLSVDVYMRSVYPKVLHGFVESNESTYKILVTNDDSSKAGSKDYLRQFTITLQSDKTLVVHKYEYNLQINADNTIDTFEYACTFRGEKTKVPLK